MTVKINETDNYYLIKLFGDFDSTLSEEARTEFSNLAQRAEKSVVLDLSDVEFIDSSGVGAIVFLYKRLRCKNLELSICNPQEQPYELIRLLRIDKIMDVKTTI